MSRRRKRELSEEIRERIIFEHSQCKGYKTISKELSLSVSTVANIIKKFKVHGTIVSIPGRGRKKKIDPRMKRKIV
ncbi:hypothetical protein LDENG_00097760 [Lucifuga dentata]|nr:hypothetical protein LDENG_00097760 [Lucifuga dentata]